MAFESTITKQGQSTIPKNLRDKYGLTEGDKVVYVDLGDYMGVIPILDEPLKALSGIINTNKSVSDMRKEALDAAIKAVKAKRARHAD